MTLINNALRNQYSFLQTVDQFFSLKVPMSSKELNGMFRGVDNAFQVYANHVTDKLGEYIVHVYS